MNNEKGEFCQYIVSNLHMMAILTIPIQLCEMFPLIHRLIANLPYESFT